MRAKKVISVLLSLGLCAGLLPAYSVSAKETSTEKSSKTQTSTENILGDVDGNGAVDGSDATLVLREYTSLSGELGSTFTSEQGSAADVNGDGAVDGSDATLILAYYSYVSSFGEEEFEVFLNGRGIFSKEEPKVTTSVVTSVSSTTTTTAKTTTKPKTSITTTTSKTTTSKTTSKTTTSTTTKKTTSSTTSKKITTSTSTVTSTTTVDVNRVQSIKLSKTEITVEVGKGDISMVTMLPETAKNKAEKWSCSNEKIAVVDNEGYITGVSAGTCTVTVQSIDNPSVKANIKVTVKNPAAVNEIKLSKYEMSLNVGTGDVSMVTMLPEDAADKSEIWTSSDEKVAVVDGEGYVTGIGEGECTITVKSVAAPEVKAEIKVTVTDITKVSGIKLTKNSFELGIGEKAISIVTMIPDTAADKSENWTSSDEKVAVVDEFGWITAVGEGSCVVTVQSVSNPKIKAEINVNVFKEKPAVTVPEEHLKRVIDGVMFIDGILLVNKSYGLPENYEQNGLNPTVQLQFSKLASDAALEGMDISISSGYRSFEQQEKIYNNYLSVLGTLKTDTFAARAGHSEHQTGIALDVNASDESFAESPESEWLEKHAHEYGFIIRYPKDKESITGFSYEPWHLRYVGKDAATAIHESGLCLEEYLGADSYYHD